MFRPPDKPELYALPIESGAIVLDLAAERYYTLDCGDHQSMDETFFHSRGITVHGDAIDMDKLASVEALRSSFPTTMQCLFALLRAVAYVVSVRALFGTGAVIRHLRQLKRRWRPSQSASRAPHTLPSATHAFRRFRPFLYTASNHCLFDAMVLAAYLLTLGFDTTFVVAVRTQPFQAHAWTQSGNYLVDDCPEKVQLFSPILVV